MKLKAILPIFMLALLVAGCGQSNSGVASQGSALSKADGDQAEPSSSGQKDFVTIAFDNSKNESKLIATNQTIGGKFASPLSGEIGAVGVLIGNFSNSSAGQVRLTICQNSVCAEGIADLAGSKDNSYLRIALSKPLTLVSGQEVSYTLKRLSGSNSLAVWVYPSRDSSTNLTLPDGKSISSSLNIRLEKFR
jgi:hypothetical protein